MFVKTYEIFLFDADGTLFDYNAAESRALGETFAFFGLPYSERVLKAYGDINAHIWEDFEKERISISGLQTERFARLFKAVDISCDAGAFNKKYLVELGKGAQLNAGAREICEKIVSAGKKIYIVTNGIFSVQDARINGSAIKKYISGSFVSESVGYRKPQAEYFDYVFARVPQAGKDKIIIVGDSLTADIAGGNNAGIDTCWYNERGAENASDAAPTYEINKLSEAEKFI